MRRLATSPCLDDPANANAALHRAFHQIESKPAYAAARLSEFESTFKKRNGITLNDSEVPLLPRSLGDLSLAVLTASRHPAAPADFSTQEQAKYYAYWKAGHDHLAELSRCGSNVVVPNTGHFIRYDQPRLVITAILAVGDLSRASRRAGCVQTGADASAGPYSAKYDKRRYRKLSLRGCADRPRGELLTRKRLPVIVAVWTALNAGHIVTLSI